MSLVLIAAFLALMVAVIPVAHALVIASGVALLWDGQMPLLLVAQQMFAQTQSFPMLALPFFILAGTLIMEGKLHALWYTSMLPVMFCENSFHIARLRSVMMPTSEPSPMTQPCSIAMCPTVTWRPIVRSLPGSVWTTTFATLRWTNTSPGSRPTAG